jgi:hypothetical protein
MVSRGIFSSQGAPSSWLGTVTGIGATRRLDGAPGNWATLQRPLQRPFFTEVQRLKWRFMKWPVTPFE